MSRMFGLPIITLGMLIPWGFSWFRIYEKDGNNKHKLVFCIRLPFYWIDRDYLTARNVWGGAVLRVRFFDSCNIIWIPDYQFKTILPDSDEELFYS